MMMRKLFAAAALGAAILVAACSEPDPNERTLIEVLQPTAQSNYGVFIWRQARSANPTQVYFGLAAFQNAEKNYGALLMDVEPFGVADFTASQVHYGWSDLKDFSVCAARFKELKPRESSVFSAVMDSVSFSSDAKCTGGAFSSFPPSIGAAEPKE